MRKKECGCYQTIDFRENDQCWMSHTTTVTYYYRSIKNG